MDERRLLTVEEETTLLPFLLLRVKDKSRNTVKGLLSRRQVMVDGKVVEEGVTHLENWKGLRVGSVTEREALWTAPELECRIHFVTGVDYRVQILNGKLRIWASDMPQVLEYTIGTRQQEALLATLQNA